MAALLCPPNPLLNSPTPYYTPLCSGEDIKRAQSESTVFLRGPEGSPALKAAAAQPRPVAHYTLDKPAPPSAFGSTEQSRASQASSFSLSQMAAPTRVEHGAPRVVRGGRSAEAEAAAAEAMSTAAAAAQECHKRRQALLAPQWSIAQAGGGR